MTNNLWLLYYVFTLVLREWTNYFGERSLKMFWIELIIWRWHWRCRDMMSSNFLRLLSQICKARPKIGTKTLNLHLLIGMGWRLECNKVLRCRFGWVEDEDGHGETRTWESNTQSFMVSSFSNFGKVVGFQIVIPLYAPQQSLDYKKEFKIFET